MKFSDIKVFKNERFSIEKEIISNKYCISFPVCNHMGQYTEFYEITDEEFKQFTSNYDLLTQFVNECKQRKNDNRLLEKPGKWRGDPC